MSAKCPKCSKSVYFNEQVIAEGGGKYHEACFKCSQCKKALARGKEHVKEGVLYCDKCRPGQAEGFRGGTAGGGTGGAKYNSATGGSYIPHSTLGENTSPRTKGGPPESGGGAAGGPAKFCSNCGAKATGGKFCAECGTKF